MRRIFNEKTKPLPISKEMVWKAYKKVRSNKGSAGVDNESIQKFEENLSDNLYKLWNRLASGSYFPPAVKEQEINKDNGKKRKLGIPTVSDRIAQQVIKEYLEPRLEKEFHESSYGYRPFRNAHQALTKVRENARKYAWVIDLDITAFFDHVDHKKLLTALEWHAKEKWVNMYVKRWLEAPIAKANGELEEKKGRGTPQGGVISPLLANLYLHYTFDKWMAKHFPTITFVRYADDIVIHCVSEKQSLYVLGKLKQRLSDCNLTIHPEKTHVVYCKASKRKPVLTGKRVKFDFLGFSFRPESKWSKHGDMSLGYDCKISQKSYSKIVKEIKRTRFDRWAKSWQEIADLLNSKIRGWVQYYDGFRSRAMSKVFHRLHNRLIKWIMNRYKRFRGKKRKAIAYLKFIYRRYPYLFYHWSIGYHLV
ncbi:MAG: group II intron reverse transcriptase/maturase [Bacteroidales bacterium]|nr:group II intron reverse transcriptase/maturase [Bacteroidales bacterium]